MKGESKCKPGKESRNEKIEDRSRQIGKKYRLNIPNQKSKIKSASKPKTFWGAIGSICGKFPLWNFAS